MNALVVEFCFVQFSFRKNDSEKANGKITLTKWKNAVDNNFAHVFLMYELDKLFSKNYLLANYIPINSFLLLMSSINR